MSEALIHAMLAVETPQRLRLEVPEIDLHGSLHWLAKAMPGRELTRPVRFAYLATTWGRTLEARLTYLESRALFDSSGWRERQRRALLLALHGVRIETDPWED